MVCPSQFESKIFMEVARWNGNTAAIAIAAHATVVH